MPGKRINIAIDGHSGCGKSTTARIVAKKLGYTYIDTGAMYRAVTLYFLRNKVDLGNIGAIVAALEKVNIRFRMQPDGMTHTMLNGEDVESEIRSGQVSDMVSQVSAIPVVRRAMVAQQQEMGKDKGVVMDGRDIGSIVFPDAELKIFMTADPVVRARRRNLELKEKGLDGEEQQIMNNLLMRDRMDSTREDSPLIKSEGAVQIDTTHLSLEEQTNIVINEALDIIKDGSQ